MDGGAWWATVHGVAKSLTRLSDSTFTFTTVVQGFPGGSVVKNPPAVQETQVRLLSQEDPLEKEMATHSSILAWKTPRTEEPGGLQFIGLQRVRHN